MHARLLAASLTLVSFAAYGQAILDDTAIGKLVKAGVGEQTIVDMINQHPGGYALSADEMIALKKAGASAKILAALFARTAADGPSATSAEAPPAAVYGSTTPFVLTLPDATPIRLGLTVDLTFTNVKPGDRIDFEILDDLRIDGVLVIARGAKASATITMAEPMTWRGTGGRLGVNLDSIPLLTGNKAAIRAGKEAPRGGRGDTPVSTGGIVRPVKPPSLFSFGKGEFFPEGTEITAYSDGEIKLDAARFLVDIAFSSNLPGTRVTMYGAAIGLTPFTTKLAPGIYRAVFSADGYPDLTRSISVGPGHSNAVNALFKLQP